VAVRSPPAPSVSIIIPTLNEAQGIVAGLQALLAVIAEESVEVILADGGSTDKTVALAKPYVDQIVTCSRGRGRQMNAGAAAASGHYLLFLHCDTQLPQSPFSFLERQPLWGFYAVRLSGEQWLFRIIERMMTLRSSLTAVATGDQGLFVQRSFFTEQGGFADMPLMEDVEISKRLRRHERCWAVPTPVVTSSRRWEQNGLIKTVFTMWYLRALYFLGVSPSLLAKQYYRS
jgi:rSAM/selenodomain-associated transferase 2